MISYFIRKKKSGENQNMCDLCLDTAAKNFKYPKEQEVRRYKAIKIMKEIKNHLEMNTISMEEKHKYDQLKEILSRLK